MSALSKTIRSSQLVSRLKKAYRNSLSSFSDEKELQVESVAESPPDPAKLQGKVYDLSKKQLVDTERFKIFVMEDDLIGYSIKSSKSWEPAVSAILADVLDEGSTFVDIGANIGWFTNLAASKVGDEGRVISFEPNPQNVQMLLASVAKNNFENVTVYPLAVSDRHAIFNFQNFGSNGLIAKDNTSSNLKVQAVPLDEVLWNLPKVDALKIDVEAHETFALRGADTLLRQHRPVLLTEYHPWAMKEAGLVPKDYLFQLTDLGYRLSVISPEGGLVPAHDEDFIVEYWEALDDEFIHLDLLGHPNSN